MRNVFSAESQKDLVLNSGTLSQRYSGGFSTSEVLGCPRTCPQQGKTMEFNGAKGTGSYLVGPHRLTLGPTLVMVLTPTDTN